MYLTSKTLRVFRIISSLLALFIGVMSVIVGSSVLLGIDTKTYTILNWLVIYNILFGIISIGASYAIWVFKEKSRKISEFIFISHLVLFIYLKFIAINVASESVQAMGFRTLIWILILILSVIMPNYFKKLF